MPTLHAGSKQSNIAPSIDKYILETIFNPIGVHLYRYNEEIPVDLDDKPESWGVIDLISTGAIGDFEKEDNTTISQKKEMIANISCFQKMHVSLGVGADRYGLTSIIDQFAQEMGALGFIPILDFSDPLKPQVAALEITNTPSHIYIDTYEPHGIRMCVVSVPLSYSEAVAY